MTQFNSMRLKLKCTYVHRKEKETVDTCMNGILLPKLFWPTLRKNCSCDQEIVLKFEAKGREFAKKFRSQFIQTMKGQNNLW